MGWIRSLGILIVLVGCALLWGNHYIVGKVAEGREEIESAQTKVNTGKKLFSLDPTIEKLASPLTNSAQKKIDAGSKEADQYASLAHSLKIGGIASLIAGVAVILLGGKRSSTRP